MTLTYLNHASNESDQGRITRLKELGWVENPPPQFNEATQHTPVWDGTQWKVTDKTEGEMRVMSVSKVGMLLAMAEKGLYIPDDPTSALTAAIASMSDPAQKAATQVYFQFETVVKRFHPVVLGLQQSLELDDAAVDALFVAAKAKDSEP